jgi:4-amino-4-deoxy-L-arabinose transferase-like glycosyltransferase
MSWAPRHKNRTLSAAVATPPPQVAALSGAPSTDRLARLLGPGLPLLPILAFYTILSLGLHAAPNDEPNYLQYANQLLASGFDKAHAWGYMWHGPALPLLLAPMVDLGVPLKLMRIVVGPVPLFITLLLFHRMVRPYLRSDRAALIATYALAAYLPFLSIIEVIHVEPLTTLWLTLAVFFMLRSWNGGRWDHLWAAVSFALLALSRVEYGYVLLAALVLSIVWLLVSHRRSLRARRSALATLVALLLCSPWLAYTYSVTHKPFYWGDAGGLSLYWMSAPGSIGDWHPGSATFTIPGLAIDRPVFAELNHLNPLAWDARLTHIAVQNIEHHPMHYLSNVVNNIGRLLFNAPYSFDNEHTSGLGPPWGLMLYALPDALLLGLVAIALGVAVKLRRRLGGDLLPIAVLAAMGFAIHVPVASYGRFVVPLVPIVVWLVIAVLAPNVRLAGDRDDVHEQPDRPAAGG